METISEKIEPEGPNEDKEITLEQINKDVENINDECKKINCHPVINVFSNIYKSICHLIKCFKFKKD